MSQRRPAAAAAASSPSSPSQDRRNLKAGMAAMAGGGNSSAPTSPGRLNPDVKAFEAPNGPGYSSQSAPTSPDRGGFGSGFDARDRLLRHLSYYFSIDNLIKDVYLVSHMNPEYFVPCSLIANFPAVQKLTTDVELVVQLLRTCQNVQVTPDGSMVRPLAMPPQSYAVPMPGSNTPYLPPMACVVFGEAMSEAPEEQVAALFQETCTPLTLMKGESNAWTAKFPSDDIAQKALRHVTQAEFKGATVEAEVQPDKGQRVGTFGQAPYDPRFQQQFFGGMYPGYPQFVPGMAPMYGYPQFMFDGSMQGYPRPPGQSGGYLPPRPFSGNGPANQGHGKRDGLRGPAKVRGSSRSNSTELLRPHSGSRDRHASAGDEASGPSSKMTRRPSDRAGDGFAARRGDGVNKSGKKSKSTGSDGKRSEQKKKYSEPAPELAPENFPALPGGIVLKASGGDQTPATSGGAAVWKNGPSPGSRAMADIVKGRGPGKDAQANAKPSTSSSTESGADNSTMAAQSVRSTAGSVVSGRDDGAAVNATEYEPGAKIAVTAKSQSSPTADAKEVPIAAAIAAVVTGEGSATDPASVDEAPKLGSKPAAVKGADGPPLVRGASSAPWASTSRTAPKPSPTFDTGSAALPAAAQPTATDKPSVYGSAAPTPASQGPSAPALPWGKPSDGGKPSFAEMLKRANEGKK